MNESLEFGLAMAAVIFVVQLPVYLLCGWVAWRLWLRINARQADVDEAFRRNLAEMPEIGGGGHVR